ncbi:MAG TPA: MFS transporter [Gammaproteobacteria bacterium]|nr:MFS transporter [Gammaproteobacteria bacterium]
MSIKNEKKSIWPLLWVMIFDHTSLNIIVPVLTLLFFDSQSSLFPADTSEAVRSIWYGLCISVPNMVNMVVTPVLSACSDAFGRKRLIFLSVAGALVFTVTAGLGILAGSLTILFVSCVLRGAFSRTNPIAQAVVGDISPKEKKVLYMGYLQTSISLGAFIGPILGGYFANQFFFSTLNFSLPFFIASAFALIGCVLTLMLFRETLIDKHETSAWKAFHWENMKSVFKNPFVLRISAILLLSQISWSTYYQFIPPVMKTVLHVDAHQLGLFVGLIAFWLAVATTFGIKFLDQFFSMRTLLLLSLYLVFLGTVLTVVFFMMHLTGAWTLLIWAAAIPTAVGDVIAFSCLTALYSDVVNLQEQGKVMGVCFIVIALIWSATAMIGGVLMSIHPLLPLVVGPVGIVMAIALMHSEFGRKIGFH